MSTRGQKLEIVKRNIKTVPDFPKPGILFRDIFGVLGNPEACAALFDIITEDCKPFEGKVDAVCGLDSRGFLFGPHIALQLKVPFIPIRKKGKLPGKVLSKAFQLEYGSDAFEIQTEFLRGGSVLIADDLLATGGSLKAAGSLTESLGCKVELCLVVIELDGLKGRESIPYPVHSILNF